jgi:hypothetical protein
MEIDQHMRRITLVILFEGAVVVEEDGQLPSFTYNANRDPWDNLAAARYIYERVNDSVIVTDEEYVDMMITDEYKAIV